MLYYYLLLASNEQTNIVTMLNQKPSAVAASDDTNEGPPSAFERNTLATAREGSQKSGTSSTQGSFFCGDRPQDFPKPKECAKEDQKEEKEHRVTVSLGSDYIGDSPFPKSRFQKNESIQRSLSVFAIDIEPQLDETFLQNINFPIIDNLPHETFWTHAPPRWNGKRLFLVARTIEMFGEIATVLFVSKTVFSEATSVSKILTLISLTGLSLLFELRSGHQQDNKIETLSSLMDVLWKQVEWSETYLMPYVKEFEAKVLQAQEQENPEILEAFLEGAMRVPLFAHRESLRGLWMYMKALKVYLENCYEALKELEEFEEGENGFWSNIQHMFNRGAEAGLVVACLFKTSGIIEDNVLYYIGQIIFYIANLIQHIAGSSYVVVKEGNINIAHYSAKQAEFKNKIEAYRETTYRLGLQKCIHKGMAGEIRKLEGMKKENPDNCFSQLLSGLAYPFTALKGWFTQEKNSGNEKKRTSSDWYSSRDRRPSVIFTEQYFRERPTNTITLFLEIMINRHYDQQRGRDVLTALRHLGFESMSFSSPFSRDGAHSFH